MFVLSTLVIVSGCATRGNVDLLESRLRQQEDELYSMHSNLQEKDQALKSAKREVHTLQAQLSTKTQTVSYPEQTHLVAQAEGVRFNKLRTGGLDEDGQQGDDVLSAVLTPFDASNDLVKLPGQVEFRLYDLAQPKGQQKLGQWKFGSEATSEHWHKSFLASGYLFKLPWQKIPTNQELTLVARFKTPDGRSFQANHIVKIQPPNNRGGLQQVSYSKTNKPYLNPQTGKANQAGIAKPSSQQSEVKRTVSRIKNRPMLNLSPPDQSDSKSEDRKPVATSTSLRKFDRVKYN